MVWGSIAVVMQIVMHLVVMQSDLLAREGTPQSLAR